MAVTGARAGERWQSKLACPGSVRENRESIRNHRLLRQRAKAERGRRGHQNKGGHAWSREHTLAAGIVSGKEAIEKRPEDDDGLGGM